MTLEVRRLTVRYGSIAALRDVSLSVPVGQLITVVGPNAAGKSTLLSSVAGLVRPKAGTITFEGEDITARDPERIARAGISLVPEGRHVFSSLTVRENLSLGLLARRGARHPAAMADAVDRVPGLSRLMNRRASTLSGGEQQMVAIARALVASPRLLMLDEPSLGLAPKVVDAVFAVLKSLHADGVAILLVEQQSRRAMRTADWAYVLQKGQIERSGPPASFSSDEVADHFLSAARPPRRATV